MMIRSDKIDPEKLTEEATHAEQSLDFPKSDYVYRHLNHRKEKCSHVHRGSERESQSHLIKVKTQLYFGIDNEPRGTLFLDSKHRRRIHMCTCLTWNGQKPLSLNGTTQTLIQDLDHVTLSAVCAVVFCIS
ncbi:hypothetical protein YC2023_020242 [Brassica napus]